MLIKALVKQIKVNHLENLSKNLRESSPEEAQDILGKLSKETYAAYLDYILTRSAKAFIRENARCRKDKRCSLDTYYDTEHP